MTAFSIANHMLIIQRCLFHNFSMLIISSHRKLKKNFTTYLDMLLSCCDPKLLIKWCENLMASEKHKVKLLPPCSLYELKKLKTSSAVLKLMSTLWSWNNHSILTCLASFSEIASTLLKDLDSRLYLNASFTEYPISSPTPSTSMIPYNNNSYTI